MDLAIFFKESKTHNMKEKNIFKESILYVLMFMALMMLAVGITSCSTDADEYINEEWSGKQTDKYRIASMPYDEGFGIKVLSRNPEAGTVTVRMLYNNLQKPEVLDCRAYVVDARILKDYEPCPYCRDECEE